MDPLQVQQDTTSLDAASGGLSITYIDDSYQTTTMDCDPSQVSHHLGSPVQQLEDTQETTLDSVPDGNSLEKSFVQAPVQEPRRITRPSNIVDNPDPAYSFASGPSFSKNHFSGAPAAPFRHFENHTTPKPASESSSKMDTQAVHQRAVQTVQEQAPQPSPASAIKPMRQGDWKSPQTSPILKQDDLFQPTERVKKEVLAERIPREKHESPSLDPAKETRFRKNGHSRNHQIECAYPTEKVSHIGDLDLPADAKAKRTWNESHRSSKTEVKQPRRSIEGLHPSELLRRHTPTAGRDCNVVFTEENPIATRDYHPRASIDFNEGIEYHGADYASANRPDASHTSLTYYPARPVSQISNVSKRRRDKQRSGHPVTPDTPMQRIRTHVKAIDEERARLRWQRNYALRKCNELESDLRGAKDRIATGKRQLQESTDEQHALKFVNESLQAQVETLQRKLKASEKATADAEARVIAIDVDLQASKNHVVMHQNRLEKLRGKYSLFKNHLNKTIAEQQALSQQSEQHFRKTLAECHAWFTEIQHDRQLIRASQEVIERGVRTICEHRRLNQEKDQTQERLLHGRLQQAEEQLRRVKQENTRLRQDLEHQRQDASLLETYKEDVTRALSSLQTQLEADQTAQGNDGVLERLDTVLSLLESSSQDSRNSTQAVEDLEDWLKETLRSYGSEVQDSTISQENLMKDIKRIEQTLCCEMTTMREAHSTRESEMRRELIILAEEKAVGAASLEAERQKFEHAEARNKKMKEEANGLRATIDEMEAERLTAQQQANSDHDILRQDIAAKQKQIETMQESTRLETEKYQQETAELTGEIQQLRMLQSSGRQNAGEALADINKLQESESRALQELQVAQEDLARLKADSDATADDLRKKLETSEQRCHNLSHRLRDALPSPSGSSPEVLDQHATRAEQQSRQLAATEKYLEKLAKETTDIKEMEDILRALFEIQRVFLTTHEVFVHVTTEIESVRALNQHCSPGVSDAAAPVNKQIVFRTPSQDGEEPGATAVEPGRERMQRRIRGPEKSILRQAKTGNTAGGQLFPEGLASIPQQTQEISAPLNPRRRTYSRPVEGKPAQAIQPLGGGNAAVQSIKTMLVGCAHSNGPNADALTSLAVWNSGTQETMAPLPSQATESHEEQVTAGTKRQLSVTDGATTVPEEAMEAVEPTKKRLRTYANRTRSQAAHGLPPSNQQAQAQAQTQN